MSGRERDEGGADVTEHGENAKSMIFEIVIKITLLIPINYV